MHVYRCLSRLAVLWIFTLSISVSLAAEANGKKVLTLEDYPLWKQIVSTSISADGQWVSYGYRPNDGDDTLYIKNLSTDKIHEIAGGANPKFSEDSNWVAYDINLPKKEAEKLRKERKPVSKKIELLNLNTGEKSTEENGATFVFANSSKFWAVKKAKADRQAKHDGTDLILHDLGNGMARNIGNVGLYLFNKPGTMLAYTISAADQVGNGTHLVDLDTGVTHILDSGKADFAQLTWDKEGTALAVIKGSEKKDHAQKENVLLAFADASRGAEGKMEYNPRDDSQFPGNMVLSEKGTLKWIEDKSRIFFGIKEQEKVEKHEDPVANLDIWHWRDERVQSIQMVRAERDRNSTYLSSLNLSSKKFTRLADEAMPTVTATENGKWAIGQLDKPYRLEISWGGNKADYYRIDVETGERTLIEKRLGRTLGASPDSEWFLYLHNKDLWIYNLETGQKKNYAKVTKVNFVNEDDDHPYEKPPYGLAGWSKDGRSVLVNHKFDLWSLPLDDGKAVNITGGIGEKEQIRFRYVSIDPDAPARGRFRGFRGPRPTPKPIDTSQPLLLSAYGEWTKKSGYYRLAMGETPKPLIFEDRTIGQITKAKKADFFMFTKQTFVEFPNYYVSNTEFANAKKVTDANPQQSEYSWGSRKLIDYENGRGIKLQATLAIPDGYREGDKYPMLVYFYEKMSNQHHRYSMPRYDDRPHFSTYVSDGYLVLQPDNIYVTGRPGSSALDCTTSAIKKVVEMGYADPERIALQGHSWGGYESSFLLTQTDMFCAVVTGAPVTNMISFYNELYKSSGTVQQGIMEVGQVRMGTHPWKDFDLYVSQSPVHQAENITTPFLILHGTEDGAVDWHQGLEYYNAARRLGKQVILLSYPGEGHHLTRLENQKDFLARMKQFFDHYCKDKPAAEWMIKGRPFLKKPKATPADGAGGARRPPRQ